MAAHPKVISSIMHPARKIILILFSFQLNDLTFNENILKGETNKNERAAISIKFGTNRYCRVSSIT